MIPKSLLQTLSSKRGSSLASSSDDVPADAEILLSEISEIAGVSPSREFFHDVWAGVGLANTIHAIQHGGVRARKKSVRELIRLGKACSKYAEVLKECSAHTAFSLSIVRPHFHSLVMPDLSRLASVITEISAATREATDVQATKKKNFALKQLVLALLGAVDRAGGQLTLDEFGMGTLASVLDKLRDAKLGRRRVLRHRLIPKAITRSLQLAKDDWDRTAPKNAHLLLGAKSLAS